MLSDQPIAIPRFEDERGNLSFIEGGPHGVCPFEIERVYWIYDVPSGRERHGRALRRTSELIVALSGSFEVQLTDAAGNVVSHTLTRSDRGVTVPPMTWRRIINFSTNSVAMVLASAPYTPEEYIFDYDEYTREANF